MTEPRAMTPEEMRDAMFEHMRRTLNTMGHDELIEEVKKLRKQKARLKERLKQAKLGSDFFEADSVKGGSIIRIEKAWDAKGHVIPGLVQLTVGEQCVYTVRNEKFSVTALAMILTRAKDNGFQTMLDEHLARWYRHWTCELTQEPQEKTS